MTPVNAPVLLVADHSVDSFDCGSEPLNRFLKSFALTNQMNDSSRTYVATNDHRVVGYYSLTPGSVTHEDAPERVAKGLARHDIGVVLMARFAVDVEYQGKGVGRSLFLDALGRVVNACEAIGGRAFFVHAKDEAARAFYEKFGMTPTANNGLHLYMLIKDVWRTLSQP